MLTTAVEVSCPFVAQHCPECRGAVLKCRGYVVRLHLSSSDPGIRDTVQTLRAREKVRCSTCGEHVSVPQIFAREAEAQIVADEVRTSINSGSTIPRQYRFR